MVHANHSRQLHVLQKEIIIIIIITIIIMFITIFNLECTSTHPMDNSCEFITIGLNKYALTLMVTMAIVAILKICIPKLTTTHPKNIPMKFHYNRTKTFFKLSCYHGNDGHIHVLEVKMNNNNKWSKTINLYTL